MRIDRVKLIAEMARADMGCMELAQNIGVSRATIGAIRSGKGCREETARRIAAALGIPLEELQERRKCVNA